MSDTPTPAQMRGGERIRPLKKQWGIEGDCVVLSPTYRKIVNDHFAALADGAPASIQAVCMQTGQVWNFEPGDYEIVRPERHGAEALETLEKVKEWLRADIALAEDAGFGGSDRVAILLEVLEQMEPTREGR